MSWIPSSQRPLVTAVLLSLAFPVQAQESSTAEKAAAAKPAEKPVEKISVKALPLDAPVSELAQPVTVLTSDELRRKRGASIGDTLSQELGVQSSAFGPGAGRPIIRGLDAARVRVLENGVGTLDVSTLSPDHMVTTESSHAEQIEILRGPASLLYGSGAIGGVVNVVSNLIPAAAQTRLAGDAELRVSSGNRERTGAANLAGGDGNVAWHVDGFTRTTKDYAIPDRAVRADPSSARGKLPGSDVDAEGAGAGMSFTRPSGYVGAGVSGLRNTYGLPTGEGTFIRLRQNRAEVAGEAAQPLAGIERIKFRAARGDYEHSEIEPSGEVATTFKNKGSEGRVEFQHAALHGWKGAFGVQLQRRDVSVVGEEAYIPQTRANATGFFLVEERSAGAWTFSGGVRHEREKLRPRTDLPERDFTLSTLAAGAVWKFAPSHRVSLNLTRAERAAAIEELYSFGPHAATATFDVGDAALRKESSRNVDLTLQKVTGAVQWKINLFANRMTNYIFARNVDTDGDGVADRVDDAGDLTPDGELLLQQTAQSDADFRGYEAELSWKPSPHGLSLRVFTDRVRAKLKGGGNLPRISPGRFGVEVADRWGDWAGRVNLIRVQAQKRLAELETPTAGYTRVNAEVTWRGLAVADAKWLVFLQGNNLLNREIRLHTSYLKDLAPQPGRSFTVGVRAEF